VLLSGGVDSSAVTALAVRASPEAVKTFSISFAESSFDESSYARGVAKFLGTDHHEERLSANLAANLVGEIGSWMDEPFSDPSLVPTYLLSRFTRRHVTVALGGDGGDELFAGYPMYWGHRLAEIYARVPGPLKSAVIEPLVRLLPVKTKNLSFDYKALRFITGAKYDPVARHHVWFGSFTPEEHSVVARFQAPPEILRYVIVKGPIAVSGVSLTVITRDAETFSVGLIPYTQANTNLMQLQPGDRVNLESDIIARYVESLLEGLDERYAADK